MDKRFIYHLVRPKDWEKALAKGKYSPTSLATEGFIHGSWSEQVAGSANKHFADADTLVILVIPTSRVKKILKEEVGREEQMFPHLYGNIQLDDVIDIKIMERNSEGNFVMED